MPLPFRLVSRLDPHLDDSFLNRFAEPTEIFYRKSCLLDLLLSPSTITRIIYGKILFIKLWRVSNYSPDLDLNPLHFAVLQHSMDRVLRYLKKYRPQDETRQSESTFGIAECAIGWQSGLVLLSEAGYQLDDALKLTIFRGDLSSLQTLLTSESYLTNSSLEYTLCLNCYGKRFCTHPRDLFTSTQHHRSFKQETMKHFVNAIKSRRQRLLSLALSKLPETVVRSFNLDSSGLLDTEAPTIVDMLRKNGIKVPVCLNPNKTPIFSLLSCKLHRRRYSVGGSSKSIS